MKKSIIALVFILLTGFALAGCGTTDVVLKYSKVSLDKILADYPDIAGATDTGYTLSVDGQALLVVEKDYSKGGQDVLIQTPLKPFTDAGLSPDKLGTGYAVQGDNLLLYSDFGEGNGTGSTLADALFQSVAYNRKALGYHQALDHYGIKLERGKFEWAKDYTTNDKDVVFVLNAQPLSDAGVDVQTVAGWTFKTMQQEDGSDIDVLLKFYDLNQ